jgi:uncharacterized membrane protein
MAGQAEAVDSFVKAVGERSWQIFLKDPVAHVLGMLTVSILGALSLGIALGPLLVGYLEMVRRGSRGEPVAFDQVFSGFNRFVPAFVIGVLVAIGVVVGSLLLVLPGIAFAFFACFAFPALTYEGKGPVEAIQRSFALVRDNLVNVAAVLIVVAILQSLGGVVLLGVILTGPLSMIALAVAFDRVAKAGQSGGANAGYSPEVRVL